MLAVEANVPFTAVIIIIMYNCGALYYYCVKVVCEGIFFGGGGLNHVEEHIN